MLNYAVQVANESLRALVTCCLFDMAKEVPGRAALVCVSA